MHLIVEEDYILQSFRPRLRGTNLKHFMIDNFMDMALARFRPRLRGTNLKPDTLFIVSLPLLKAVSVPDYGELILNLKCQSS